MNKHEEAYNLISGEVIFNALALGDERYKEIMKALDILRELAEKETPKKPRPLFLQMAFMPYKCPICEELVNDKKYKYKYCPNCGQKIDWGEGMLDPVEKETRYRMTIELLEHYEEKPPKEDGVLVKDLLDEKGYDIVHYTKPNCFVWYGFFTTKNTNPLDIRLYKKVLLLYENNTENGIRRVIAI